MDPVRAGIRIGVALISLIMISGTAHAARSVTVGILSDGPAPVFNQLKELFTSEILVLTEGEFAVTFPDRHILQADWTIEEIENNLQRLEQTNEVDIILALGFVSSLVAARESTLEKPTFAPLVLDSNLVNLPRDGDSSGVRNLNYLTEEVRFRDDLRGFRDIVPFKRLALLVDETIFRSVPDLATRGARTAQDLDIDLTFVLNNGRDQDLVAAIPQDSEAVMVAALPRLDAAARQRLIEGLLIRGLPSYSLIGTTPVERGLLAAAAPDSDWQRLARKTALNIQAVLIGGNAADQEVLFRSKRQLTINMQTARALDISPRFDVLSGARVLNEIPEYDDRTWSLAAVAGKALDANLDVRASRAGLQVGDELEVQSRSLLRPQFNTSLSTTQLNDSSPTVAGGFAAERATVAAINLNQVLYSESALAAIKLQHYSQRARIANHRTLELDVVQRATTGFLQVLKAQTLVNIRKRALELSRTNLSLAQDRVRLGSTNASDVYRWQSEVATSRQELLAARALLEQAMDELNRLLDRPLAERFQTTPASLEDPALLVSRQELLDIINNQRAFNAMGELLVEQGKQNSPELMAAEALLASAERQLKSDRRSFWSPEVSLGGQVSQTLEDQYSDPASSQENESDWQIAVTLKLPIYQGGQRRSRVRQSRYTIEQVGLQRDSTSSSVEQKVRANLHAVRSSFPSIELAGEAATAARKNLDLVQDNYALGVVSIIDLLDARDASLNADQNATNVNYDFLIDLMNLQRATATFDFFLDDAEMDAALLQIKSRVESSRSR